MTKSSKKPDNMVRSFGIDDANAYWQTRKLNHRTGQKNIHRLIAKLIDKYVTDGGRVLDCGVGSGHIFRLCLSKYEMYGVEMSDLAISDYELPTNNIIKEDLNNGIPDFGIKFDAIVASWIIHWLKEPHAFLRNAKNILNNTGIIIINIPNITYYRYRIAYLFGKFPPISLSHQNFQTPSEFENMLRSCGLKIIEKTTPKRTIRAKLRPTLFSRDIVYVTAPTTATGSRQ